MVKIKKQLVSKTIRDRVSYEQENSRKVIVIHETANTKKGADAQAHADLQSKGNSREASWHYSADDKEAIQSFDHSVSVWAAGYVANTTGIHIEICVNSDGDYLQAVKNAAELTKKIMKEENISISNVKQHNHYTGKDCPRYLRNGSKGINWNGFLGLVRAGTPATPKPPSKTEQIRVNVDFLNYYDSPRWTRPTGTVGRNTILTVEGIVQTDGAPQYKTISGTYVTANPKYVQPHKKKETKKKSNLIRVKVDRLNYYDSPRWTRPTGTVGRNTLLTVVDTVEVEGAKQHKLKSGTYITANEKYVEWV